MSATLEQDRPSIQLSPADAARRQRGTFGLIRASAGEETTQSETAAHRLTAPPVVNASEAAEASSRVSLAAMLAGHVIQDGEIVQLVIKPSRWFIVLNSLLFSGVVVLVISGLHLTQWRPLGSVSAGAQLAALLIAARMMWSALQWMGRYYLLTDHRIIRLSGVFDVQIASIPLRKVSTVRLYHTVGERLLGKGSIEIAGVDHPMMFWQTISRPRQVEQQLRAAVSKSQSNGHCSG